MDKPKRVSMSKKLRFEVFKRDLFTCQYCGRKAPDVVLEVDHIKPVSRGGKNDILNLVTSCFDCNRGKGKNKLSDDAMMKHQIDEIERLAKRREQIAMLKKWRDELITQNDDEVDVVCETILMFCDKKTAISMNGRLKIKDLIKNFGIEEVIICCELSFSRYESIDEAFMKIGGIAYNRKYRPGEYDGR